MSNNLRNTIVSDSQNPALKNAQKRRPEACSGGSVAEELGGVGEREGTEVIADAAFHSWRREY